jgi:hypothetical protein
MLQIPVGDFLKHKNILLTIRNKTVIRIPERQEH